MKPYNDSRWWSDEDIERAKKMASDGVLYKSIAHELGRSEDAVIIKLSKLGFEKPGRRRLRHMSVTVRIREEVMLEARRVASKLGMPAHVWITRVLQRAIGEEANDHQV